MAHKIIKHFTHIPNARVICGASNVNEITKEYYNFLVGEIHRGTMNKAVVSIENKTLGHTSYHLLPTE